MSDINPGQSPNPNGSPVQPGTYFTGPIMAGTVPHSDGSGTLAALGGSTGTANAGFCQMSQSQPITQATNGTVAGKFATTIIIPAQSQITEIYLMVTAIWSGTTTLGIGTSASATALTTATGVSGAALGQVSVVPGTVLAQISNWDNVGNTDIQIVVLSGSTGTGTGTLTVSYIPGINNAS